MPHVPINEQGVRELEQWFKRIFRAASGIRFDIFNRGKWLWIETNGEIPTTDNGIHIFATGGKDFDIGTEGGGNFTIDAPGAGFQVTAGSFALSDAGALIQTLSINGIAITVLQSGGTFTVNDHLGSPLVTYTG